MLDMGENYFYYQSGDLYLGNLRGASVRLLQNVTDQAWYHVMLSMSIKGGVGSTMLMIYFTDGTFQHVDISALPFAPPTLLIFNGHHERTYSVHATAFNNVKIWNRLMNGTQMLEHMNLFYEADFIPSGLVVNLVAASSTKPWIPNSLEVDVSDL
jgi:hypothetical protein